MDSGIYNFTVYISLLRHDPLLLASILYFTVRLGKVHESGRSFLAEVKEANTVNDKVGR